MFQQKNGVLEQVDVVGKADEVGVPLGQVPDGDVLQAQNDIVYKGVSHHDHNVDKGRQDKQVRFHGLSFLQ